VKRFAPYLHKGEAVQDYFTFARALRLGACAAPTSIIEPMRLLYTTATLLSHGRASAFEAGVVIHRCGVEVGRAPARLHRLDASALYHVDRLLLAPACMIPLHLRDGFPDYIKEEHVGIQSFFTSNCADSL